MYKGCTLDIHFMYIRCKSTYCPTRLQLCNSFIKKALRIFLSTGTVIAYYLVSCFEIE